MSRALDRLLSRTDSDSPREMYVKRTVYVRFQLAYRFRKLAARVGFHIGDLARIIIVLGLVFRCSLLTSHEFASRTRLHAALQELERLTGRVPRRPYPFGKGPRGAWVSVWLPRQFLDFIGLYAKAVGKSRNETLALFFQYGLFLYLIGETRLLEALQPKEKTGEQSGGASVERGAGSS